MDKIEMLNKSLNSVTQINKMKFGEILKAEDNKIKTESPDLTK